jgi:hypothetical protein
MLDTNYKPLYNIGALQIKQTDTTPYGPRPIQLTPSLYSFGAHSGPLEKREQYSLQLVTNVYFNSLNSSVGPSNISAWQRFF